MGFNLFKKKNPDDDPKAKAKMLEEVKRKEQNIELLNKEIKRNEEEISKMLKIKDGKFENADAPVQQPAPIQQQYVPQQPAPLPQEPQFIPQAPQPQMQQNMERQYQQEERQYRQPQPPQPIPQPPITVELVIRLTDGSELSVAVSQNEIAGLINEIANAIKNKDIVKLDTLFVSGDKIILFKII
jgi:hypothetical protein